VKRLTPVPGAIVALVGGTVAAVALHLDVATIGTQFGGIPTGLPHVALPHFRPELLPGLVAPAVTVAMLSLPALADTTVGTQLSGKFDIVSTSLK
jgi:SulP family sulfate permease